jgi:hypothetical protein
MGIPAIAKLANGAVVSIIMSDKNGKAVAQGTGFIISRDGRIVTNYHVIEEGSSAIVKLPDGAFYLVDGVLASDKARDVAVIKAHGTNFRKVALGNSNQLQVGEGVVAIGNPLSLEATVSNGIVSGIRTSEELGGKLLQITTPISPGSSGGPLFNMSGEVIGITTLYLRGGENLNFAIPINDVKPLLLTNSTKLQNLPNGGELVKAQDDAESAPTGSPIPAAHTNPTDRDYFQQLYEAKGFLDTYQRYKADGSLADSPPLVIRNADYVCFSDNPNSGTFFTFNTTAYDKDYAEAWDKLGSASSAGEAAKQAEIQLEAIQEIAPYVYFTTSQALVFLPPEMQTFFRNGGRILKETIYEKGVKTNSLEYQWDGNTWVLPIPPTDPSAYTRTSNLLRLSIEPTTMRYIDSAKVTITVGSGDTAATETTSYGPWSGVCETIPVPK